MSNETATFPITITDRALAQIKKLIAKQPDSNSFLRLGVKGGGCSGLEYLMKIDQAPRANDLVIEQDGVKIACDPKSAVILEGSTFDHNGNLIGGGFKFDNPNAVRTCGCGTSFSLKGKSS